MKPIMVNRRKRNKLALEHLDWALGIARNVAMGLPTWFAYEDLSGPVKVALLQLAEKYDPARGVSFRAYAGKRIYGACFDSVRRREYRERGHIHLDSIEALDGVPKYETYWVQDRKKDKQCVALWRDDRTPSPEAQAASKQQGRIWAMVQMLPPRHALVIIAVYGGGMTLEALSQLVDVGPSRLSQIHREALGMLRESCAEMAMA